LASFVAGEVGDRVPRLVAGSDPTLLELSPAEGFLFSRIDGATPWKVLREIGGLSAEEVDLCLESWIAQGIVDAPSPAPKAVVAPPRAAAGPKSQRGAGRELDTAALDESLDMDVETQRRILDFEARLDGTYHAILGVDRTADARAIKRAYFDLSKEFHPDRYFRKQIGPYEKRLHAIFKRILEAYELLSDPAVRAEIERSMDAAAASAPRPASTAGVAPSARPRELTKLERLRARMPFKLPASVLAERQHRAREFWDLAQRAVSQSRFIEAASAVRLAIAFDPFNDTYRDGFGQVQVRAVEMKAEALVAEAEDASQGGLIDAKRSKDLLRLYEEALLYRPHQPDLNERAARSALECEELTKALEYAGRAVDHSPDVASHHVALAMVHRARGNPGHAAKSLEKALEIEPRNQEAVRLLAIVRRG
jgi:tetratricopeptide (TPR) repeat protein